MTKPKNQVIILGEPISYTGNRLKRQEIKKCIIETFEKCNFKKGGIEYYKIKFKFYLLDIGFSSRHKKDLDNLIKAYLDIMTGIIFKDDSQVIEIEAVKILAKTSPLTIITIKKTKLKRTI